MYIYIYMFKFYFIATIYDLLLSLFNLIQFYYYQFRHTKNEYVSLFFIYICFYICPSFIIISKHIHTYIYIYTHTLKTHILFKSRYVFFQLLCIGRSQLFGVWQHQQWSHRGTYSGLEGRGGLPLRPPSGSGGANRGMLCKERVSTIDLDQTFMTQEPY